MRKLTLILSLLVISAVSFAGSLKSEIEAMNAKVTACLKKMDIAGFEKIVKAGVTSDFKHVENGKAMNFSQMVTQMREGMKSMSKITKIGTKLKSLKESGNTATATTWHMMEGVMIGPDKKSHTMGFSGTSTDVFRKVGGKWKMASMTWTDQKMTMDGKPFDPSQMGG